MATSASAPKCNSATNGNEFSSGSGEDSEKVSKIGVSKVVGENQLKSQDRDSSIMSDSTGAGAETKKKIQQQPQQQQRLCKTQMKQSSLEGSDITFGRQNSWRKRICERTRRSRSVEEDYGENAVNSTSPACVDLIEKGLYLGKEKAYKC